MKSRDHISFQRAEDERAAFERDERNRLVNGDEDDIEIDDFDLDEYERLVADDEEDEALCAPHQSRRKRNEDL